MASLQVIGGGLFYFIKIKDSFWVIILERTFET